MLDIVLPRLLAEPADGVVCSKSEMLPRTLMGALRDRVIERRENEMMRTILGDRYLARDAEHQRRLNSVSNSPRRALLG